MTGRVALYARESIGGQTVENQLRELHAAARRQGWNIVETFTDHGVSGAKGRDKRPAYDALCKGVAARDFDMVAAWSVDRLGRSLQNLVTFLGALQAKGVDLYLHRQGIDTSTPAGKAMFQMAGLFAEFERAMIAERIRCGLARAKENGRRPGPKSRITPELRAKVAAARKAGKSYRDIGKEIDGMSKTVAQRIMAEDRKPKARKKRSRKVASLRVTQRSNDREP